MNEFLPALQPYPFEKLALLRRAIDAPADKAPIDLSIGEPKHPTPAFVTEAVLAHLHTASSYPTTRGTEALRQAFVDWLTARFRLPDGSLTADRHVLPVNGTREALFAIAQCVVNRSQDRPVVVMPNPFYQIYEGAALLAGAEPWFVNCTRRQGFLPDFEAVPESVWQRCQLLYLCSPGNPAGNLLDLNQLKHLLELAERHDFVIAADECYSEIYLDEARPPAGLLQAAAKAGRSDFHRCLVFHSLSKRSNMPGMRSGFVAGDPQLIRDFLLYRTYHGCAMPLYTQAASEAAWRDEEHVRENRRRYREKFDAVIDILSPVLEMERPAGTFYLWPELPVDDVEFARGLLAGQNVTVLPGSYLGRKAMGFNPGARHVRMALVPPLEDCAEAAERIKAYLQSL